METAGDTLNGPPDQSIARPPEFINEPSTADFSARSGAFTVELPPARLLPVPVEPVFTPTVAPPM
jgi:hypothetical protein